MAQQFLVHNLGDSVGVAIEDIDAQTKVVGVFLEDDSTIVVTANHSIPLGHKIALIDIGAGHEVTEYGEAIGKATQDIKKGDYVHTHNLKTARWS